MGMNADVFLEVLGFLDRYSLDAASLTNATGNELVHKHLSTFPLRILDSVTVESSDPMRLSGSDDDESEHKATLVGKDYDRGRRITGGLDGVLHAVFGLCKGCAIYSFRLERITVSAKIAELLRENLPEIPTLNVELENSADTNGRLEPLIEILHEVETLRLEPSGNVTVTDATLKLCLERGIIDVNVRCGADGITDDGILEFCFGESTNGIRWRCLYVSHPDISDDFLERLIQKCLQIPAWTPRLRIERAEAFDLSVCEETAKTKKKSKDGYGNEERTSYGFDGFEIVICEDIVRPDDPVFIWYTLELE